MRALSIAILAVLGGGLLDGRAGSISLSGATLAPSGEGLAAVTFDLGWENSWRDEVNFDAAWVFLKYSIDGGRTWRHGTLAGSGTNPPGFSAGSGPGLEVVAAADRKGAFFQRAADGTGAVLFDDARLLWDYAADGVSSNVAAKVRILGIEMAFVPEGPFYVGQDTTNVPNSGVFPVTYINTPDMTNGAGTGDGTIASPWRNPVAGIGRPKDVTGTFHTNYPNGYKAFYCMKYEITQGQWCDFVNMLDPVQAPMHGVDQPANRVPISGTPPHVGSATPHRAMGFVDYPDGFLHALAYMDWAALRPMSEMEFEKAARGPGLPVDRELAWGTTNYITYASLTNDGTALEGPPDTTNANAAIKLAGALAGPIRSGAFATNGSDRVKSGGSYYGIMELSGNVSERVVPTGGWRANWKTAVTPFFSAVNGDGELHASGLADNTNWPCGYKVNATVVHPLGHRGGGFAHAVEGAWTSERFYAANDYAYASDYGAGRGVRAP